MFGPAIWPRPMRQQRRTFTWATIHFGVPDGIGIRTLHRGRGCRATDSSTAPSDIHSSHRVTWFTLRTAATGSGLDTGEAMQAGASLRGRESTWLRDWVAEATSAAVASAVAADST